MNDRNRCDYCGHEDVYTIYCGGNPPAYACARCYGIDDAEFFARIDGREPLRDPPQQPVSGTAE